MKLGQLQLLHFSSFTVYQSTKLLLSFFVKTYIKSFWRYEHDKIVIFSYVNRVNIQQSNKL